MDEIKKVNLSFLLFYESLNKFSLIVQMDIAVRFWSIFSDKVSTRYSNSAFLGKCTASDLLQAIFTKLEGFYLKWLLHVSMDRWMYLLEDAIAEWSVKILPN